MNAALEQMTPFLAMDIREQARALERQGADVIHLDVGEPDFNVHPLIVDAMKDALDKRQTRYTDTFGDPELREAICRFYRREYGVEVTPDRVLVTGGSSPALLLALQVLCDVGDEVLLADPGYPCYRDFALAVHAQPVALPTTAGDGFQPDPEAVRAALTSRTRALFVNSPSNPAGTLAEPERLAALATLCPGDTDNAPVILSDEIYHGLAYGGSRAHTILEYTDNAFVINGFSKRFAMTGLRLGYLIVPTRFLSALRILQQNLFICAGSVAQRAGFAAMRLLLGEHAKSNEFLQGEAAMRSEYDARRAFMLERLRDIGMSVAVEPKGAFYVFADARRYTKDSLAFAQNLLTRAQVGVTPGTDFGHQGQGFLRFSYACPIPRIREAFNRMAEF